jgi:predicted nuclease of predicted toxin-antitoxin system
MRLLFDQNISFRILKKLEEYFPNASQVRTSGLENKSDTEIWEYAKSNTYTIVTFDADYYDLTILRGHPPKIIWLRPGNSSTKFIAELLIKFINCSKFVMTLDNFSIHDSNSRFP